MLPMFIRTFGLRCISAGLSAPENTLDRFVEFSILKDLLRKLDINCVVDVGANDGQFARNIRAIGYQGRIISFEPVTEPFARLCRNFRSDRAWSGFQIALGSADTILHINVFPMTTLSSFLDPIAKYPGLTQEDVRVRRLDSLIRELTAGVSPLRIFLKMDTQGYDLEVFRGAEGCLADVRGLVSEVSVKPIYENQPHFLDSVATYERAGFAVHHFSVVSRDASNGVQEFNAYFRRT
jgi:FkbM family methyltransferase